MSNPSLSKRSRSATRADIEAQILAAAEIVFAERGFGGATTAAIAAQAGVPKSNLHYYFPTKEALYRKVLADVLEAWLDAARSFDRGPSARVALTRYIETKMDLARRYPLASRIFAAEIMRGAPLAQDFLETTLKSWIDDREPIIRRWIASGELRPIAPRALIFAIWATTQHYADFAHQVTTLNDGRPLSDREFEATKHEVADLILNGVVVPAPLPERG